MISEKKCFVYIMLPGTTHFITAGRFQLLSNRNDVQFGEFIYGKKYLARPDAVEIDPGELYLSQQPYRTTRMHGFFGAIRDAMPDYWGRKVIEHHSETYPSEFDYLLLGPDDRAGALGFGLNVDPPAPQRFFNKTLDLEKLQKIADAVINNSALEHAEQHERAQVEKLLFAGTSMGGARPKAVVESDHKLWIAKFSSPQDRWDQPVVEHAMLTLAKKCGLKVAESKIISVAGKNILLVKRFDRDKAKEGYYRHRMVSALTLLKSDEDPLIKENWSYLLLADEIRKISIHPQEDLREIFSRMCFNALISNLDDHPRNHAFLATNKGWNLSPAYDLTPTPTHAQDSRFLAMTCGQQGRLAQRKNLLSEHERFLLTSDEAKFIIDQLAKNIKKNWYSHLRKVGVSERDCHLISSAFVYDGFDHHL